MFNGSISGSYPVRWGSNPSGPTSRSWRNGNVPGYQSGDVGSIPTGRIHDRMRQESGSMRVFWEHEQVGWNPTILPFSNRHNDPVWPTGKAAVC